MRGAYGAGSSAPAIRTRVLQRAIAADWTIAVWDRSWMAPFRVMLLPGSVLPGDLAYGSLVAVLGSASDAVVKELEVYATPEAPADYTLDLEVGGVLREADERGWQRFHPGRLFRRGCCSAC